MRVFELIEELQQVDPDAVVLIEFHGTRRDKTIVAQRDLSYVRECEEYGLVIFR